MAPHPLPIGYIEVQKSWVGDPEMEGWDFERIAAQLEQQAIEEAGRTDPGLKKITRSVTGVPDGAGVMHYTLYVGFAPVQSLSEPLDPRNLNNAGNQNIGDPARDNSLGMKERKF